MHYTARRVSKLILIKVYMYNQYNNLYFLYNFFSILENFSKTEDWQKLSLLSIVLTLILRISENKNNCDLTNFMYTS